ncbi:MAG TPA: ATP-binding protein [Clostridiales bacterium]|jgi:DNA replication protein DnaC|nr:ATP-binding protein [Clostridiales bacterium]
MGYNKENFRRIREAFATKYRTARERADRRLEEAWAAVPGLREADIELSRVGLEIMKAISAGGDTAAMIAKIRVRNEELQAKRSKLLRAAGYPADYTDLQYDCPACCDSGYADGVMCECMRRELIIAGCESSGIAQLMREQNFDNFTLDYYSSNIKHYEIMENVLTTAFRFANGFSEVGSGNLLFIGGTGLGKTHLSSAVAKRVIERGFDVLYVSAQGLISDFERERFGGGSYSGDGRDVGRYFYCDLLIVDDLGAEVTNQFTVSCLYNVINTRLNLRKSIIISTNLSKKELESRYAERITSRIFGEYKILAFAGTDVRRQKLSQK